MVGVRLLASSIDEPRARRATDALSLAGSLILLTLVSVAAEPVPELLRRIDDVVAVLPGALTPVWQIGVGLLAVAAVAVLLVVATARRLAVLRDMAFALLIANVVWPVVARAVGSEWPSLREAITATEPPAWYPSPLLAVAGAALLTAHPHLSVPVRRLSRRVLGFGTVSVVALGATTVLGAMASLLIAVIAACVVHLIVGSSGGRPSLGYVEAALAELQVDARALGAADRQDAGAFLVDALASDGTPLIAKVHGRDAHDAALVSTVWRRVWLREIGQPIRLGRLQQVEYEALMTLLVGQAGIATDRIVTVGATQADDAVLVLERPGRLLAEADPDAVPELLARLWDLVGRLHQAGISHGRLDASHLLVANSGELGVIGLRGSELVASQAELRADEVQAMATAVLLTDVERAVAAARTALGGDGVARALPFVQRSVLTPSQRRALRDHRLDLDELRAELAGAAGIEPPELIQLHRITVGSVLKLVLPAIALFALFSAASGLDLDALADALRDASWPLIGIGVVLTQVPRLSQAVSTLGASPVPLPLGPVYALQLAMAYIGIALPSTAARIGVNIRFFQRHGVPPGAAMAAGALDGFSGFLVQIGIVATIALLGTASLGLDLDVGSTVSSASGVLLLVVVLVLAAIGGVVTIARVRRFVLHWARQLAREALEALRGLHSPRRLGMLVGGNLATEVTFAVALGVFVRSLGVEIGLGELLLVNIGAALLAGIMPVPGGIGVAEGALTYGLIQVGMPEEPAFAAVVLYRLSSFYLPPLWGFVAFRWLERNEHL